MQARQAVTIPRARRVLALAIEHPVLAIFVAAVSVRIVAGIVISATGTVDTVSPDSRFYMYIADHVARIKTYEEFERFEGTFATYIWPVSWLFRIFGSYMFLAQLVAIVYAGVAAAATTRLACELLPRAWALGAGAIVAFFPSLILWSSVPLRDSAVWATVSCLALTVVFLLRARSVRELVVWAAATAALTFLLGHVRLYSVSVAAIALTLVAIAVRPAQYKVAIAATLVAVAVVIPIVIGIGPLGLRLTEYDLGEIRRLKAESAESALVPENDPNATIIDYFPRGVSVMLFEPVPWTSLRGETVRAGQVEAPLWWALLAAAATAVVVLWRHRSVLLFPALYAMGVMGVLALGEGNFGTLYRHRGEVIWALALLAVVGVHEQWTRRSAPAGVAA